MEKEIWKDIIGWEGLYQISNMARVKSLARTIKRCNGRNQTFKERILRGASAGKKNGNKYWCFSFWKNGKGVTIWRCVLIARHFIPNPDKLTDVNHKNRNTLDDKIQNLEWTSHRENISHGFNGKKKSSKYSGVSWNKNRQKWHASITINQKSIFLGEHVLEEQAGLAYQNALITNGIKNKYAKVY